MKTLFQHWASMHLVGIPRSVFLMVCVSFLAMPSAAFDYACHEHEQFDGVPSDVPNATQCNGRGQFIAIYCNDIFGKHACRQDCWHTESHCECYETDWFPNGIGGRRDQGLHEGGVCRFPIAKPPTLSPSVTVRVHTGHYFSFDVPIAADCSLFPQDYGGFLVVTQSALRCDDSNSEIFVLPPNIARGDQWRPQIELQFNQKIAGPQQQVRCTYTRTCGSRSCP